MPPIREVSVRLCCTDFYLFIQACVMAACFFILLRGGKGMTEKTPELTEEEKKIIFQIRNVCFGKVVVTVKNGQPVYVETQKTIPLSNCQ